MRYMGSKRRIWKHIAPIILQDRKKGQYYVEPFCGGCNSISNVDGNRIASDINPYLISIWKSLLKNEKQFYPIDRNLYNLAYQCYKKIKNNNFSESDLGWIGFMSSYNGKFFNGYNGESKDGRNYVDEFIRDIFKQLELLKDVEFHCCSYDKLVIPNESIIYCDIPYKGTTKYQNDFDYDKFYQWCFYKKKEGHSIFISEYNMPKEFKCIWQMKVPNSLDRYSEQRTFKTEKLFTL